MRSILVLLVILAKGVIAQEENDLTLLFKNERPLDVGLAYSFKDIRKSTSDSVFFPSTIKFKVVDRWDSIPVQVRGRGNFRRKYCAFSPIRIKMKKKDVDSTEFAGNKSLKLVLPCQPASNYNNLIYREYLCYQMYEVITKYHFNTRLANITLNDSGSKNSKAYTVPGFFIEDNDLVAKRFHGKIDDRKLHLSLFSDTLSTKHDLFQFLIGNTDWSVSGSHNECTLYLKGAKFIPLPYDFDMSGLVNASYATVNQDLEITSVKDRLYRGYCRDESIFQCVRDFYLELEPQMFKVIESHKSLFETKELEIIRKYVNEFYEIIKNEKLFNSKVVANCRR